MTTLNCKHFAKDCIDTMSAPNSAEIQKVFLAHVTSKHRPQWDLYTKQFKSVAMANIRDRFSAQAAEDLKTPATTA